MNQKKAIQIIIGIAIVVAISIAIYYLGQKPSDESKTQWVVSGPFAISKPQYKLGENIFMTVNSLKPTEAGNMIILRPSGDTWGIIPFNGTLKDHFNYYFKPDVSAALKIMKPEDLVGTWKIIFQGVEYQPLYFEITNEFIPGGEADITPVESNMTKTNSTK